jgi:hypothetical protein
MLVSVMHYHSAKIVKDVAVPLFYLIVGIARIVLVVPTYEVRLIAFSMSNIPERNIIKNLTD